MKKLNKYLHLLAVPVLVLIFTLVPVISSSASSDNEISVAAVIFPNVLNVEDYSNEFIIPYGENTVIHVDRAFHNQLGTVTEINHIYRFRIYLEATDTFTNVVNYYVLINGVKYYLQEAVWNVIDFYDVRTDYFTFGYEVDETLQGINDPESVYPRLITFGDCSFQIDDLGLAYPSILSQMSYEFGTIRDRFDTLLSNIGTFNQNILDSISSFKTSVTGWFTKLNNTIENNSIAIDNQTEVIQQEAQKEQEKQQEIIDGYDNSGGTAVNDDFSGSVGDFQAAEDNLFGMVNYDQVDYEQYSDWLGIPAVSAALSFISNCMQSLFEGLGDLGVPIMIGLVLLLFSRLIGLQQLSGSGRRSGSGSSAKDGG